MTCRRKIHILTCRPSPPLRYARLSANTTHRSSLVTQPVNCYVSSGFTLIKTCRHHTSSKLVVIYVFDPRHRGIMDIWLVSCINVIDSNLHFNGFVRIEHVRLERNHFTVRVPQRWNVWHMVATALEWKTCQKKNKCMNKNCEIYKEGIIWILCGGNFQFYQVILCNLLSQAQETHILPENLYEINVMLYFKPGEKMRNDVLFQKVTQAYSEKRNPSAPIRSRT